ncbi:hypothetical protein NDU88_000158 [Pleurodeles waltl]|uniref:Integrase catalytic domain-containing protein n=1 Tax=Pleurodeles waltl TaxID=8319 RepID=A0AAV7USB3_PLEWA|nr:hypothetical protein NDU88_000158 [Pleurodeles waltl]
MQEIFHEEGCPVKLITDNGTQLVSHEMERFLRQSGIHHSRTALYNPQANGMVERCNRMVKGVINMAIRGGWNVRTMVNDLVWAYRTTAHSVTGKIPFEKMRGSKACTKINPPWLSSVLEDGGLFQRSAETSLSVWEKDMKKGDLVKIRTGCTGNGFMKFRGPYVVRDVHEFHVVLENGERWNKRRVALYSRSNGDGKRKVDSEGWDPDENSSFLLMSDEDLLNNRRVDVQERINSQSEHQQNTEMDLNMDVNAKNVQTRRIGLRSRKLPGYLCDYRIPFQSLSLLLTVCKGGGYVVLWNSRHASHAENSMFGGGQLELNEGRAGGGRWIDVVFVLSNQKE